MAIRVQTEFIGGSTVQIRAYIEDDDGALCDPTAVTVTVTDPDGTVAVNDSAMTKNATGVYEYNYNTTSSSTTGSWRGVVKTVDGTGGSAKTSKAKFAFRVEE